MSRNKHALQILENLGGKENIRQFLYCFTRLRFEVIDRDLANIPELKKIPTVIAILESDGFFQVVLEKNVRVLGEIIKQQIK